MSSVLIIDDSSTIREKVKSLLKEADLFENYLEASNGLEGIKILSKEEVDLIICDMMMPQMDGVKFLEFLGRDIRMGNVLVIMLTSRTEVLDKIKSLEKGAVDYMTKPYHPAELLARVKVMLRIKNLQDTLKIKMQELEKVSVMDSLTGLYNQRYLYDAMNREINRAKRFHLKLSCIMLDIDHFKEVNDTFGHQRGDTILKELAKIILSILRGYDFAVRYGGDEFIIILCQNTALGAQIVAERIREIIQENPRLRALNGNKKLTISAGVATYPDQVQGGYEELISKADHALYMAKKRGRNQVAFETSNAHAGLQE
jgi:diguanylate cyclase (GGDEF)-like protein